MGFLPYLLGFAVLLPLFSFWLIFLGGRQMEKATGSVIATSAIIVSALLSFCSLAIWLSNHFPPAPQHESHAAATEHAGAGQALAAASQKHTADQGGDAETQGVPQPLTGNYWELGQFGRLSVSISYYIDSLTIVMFCMVTLIASCIHVYASGYMHDELHDVTDSEVTLRDGSPLRRPGRYHRFFQYLSLFCFSMLGLVLAGNIAMVFVFWEMVGICSYFLIGFYVERKSASNAANKAFIVNRIGDFGMIIGLMALWGALGTFSFGDIDADQNHEITLDERGLFSLVRTPEHHHALAVPDAMFVQSATRAAGESGQRATEILTGHHGAISDTRSQIESELPELNDSGYWLLFIAGVGIFCGCVGKSAQFPLHVWLPDAMEGPTPVSALVHSATMVAAGVYLVGRFFPVFSAEVLIVIATVGGITLFLAASIALTATDIKRVLAYSTVSQLGYMMLALGLGGWIAGLMHLITHAFFKSLLFMCSGSVIHAVHTNDMRKMGGLLKKMPVTAITMLVGCLAISGVGVPFVIGLSGYYSKDMILEQAYSFSLANSQAWTAVYFVLAGGGAAITSFYMFRMWYMTFVGVPRDQHAYDHAHESPFAMYAPLVVLAIFAATVAWDTSLIGFGIVPAAFLLLEGSRRGWFRRSSGGHGHGTHGHEAHGHDTHSHDAHAVPSHTAHGHDDVPHDALPPIRWQTVVAVLIASVLCGVATKEFVPETGLSLRALLEQSQPAGTRHAEHILAGQWTTAVWPNEHASHADHVRIPVTLLATGTWIIGIALATAMYGVGYLNPEDVRRQFAPIYTFLVNKWWFDELYDWMFVRPTHAISSFISNIDRQWLDWIVDSIAAVTKRFASFWEKLADQTIVDGVANGLAAWTYAIGLSLRRVQTGRLRQYVMFIVVGAVTIFILISFYWSTSLARG